VALFPKKETKKKENTMATRNKNPANPMPQKKNRTSFSKDYQPPANHYRGEYSKERSTPRHKRTVAKQAFEDLGFNPLETQINMVKMYQDMLTLGIGWDKKPITGKERETFCKEITKINQELMTYQTTKATAHTEALEQEMPSANVPVEVEDQGPLNPSELLDVKRTMGDSRKSLEDKIG